MVQTADFTTAVLRSIQRARVEVDAVDDAVQARLHRFGLLIEEWVLLLRAHRELLGMGYLGDCQRVKTSLAPLRRGLPLDEPANGPSPRDAARWIITASHRHSLRTGRRLCRPLDHCPALHRAHDLIRQFATMLNTRDATPARLARPAHRRRLATPRRDRHRPTRRPARSPPGDHNCRGLGAVADVGDGLADRRGLRCDAGFPLGAGEVFGAQSGELRGAAVEVDHRAHGRGERDAVPRV
ncbi:hypothetical protein [Kitasatospora sp. NPDC091207]|uniref:hypothetical protein n=1 Tax=Kitasatospora sp. NPDC091207 TaxID=3364083 RepID=UPI00380ADA3D